MTVANSLYTIIASKRMSINDAWNPDLGDPLRPYPLGKKLNYLGNYLDFTAPLFCTGLVSILNILSVSSCAYYHNPTCCHVPCNRSDVQCNGTCSFHICGCVPGVFPLGRWGLSATEPQKDTHTYTHITHPWQTRVAHLSCPKFTGRNFEAEACWRLKLIASLHLKIGRNCPAPKGNPWRVFQITSSHKYLVSHSPSQPDHPVSPTATTGTQIFGIDGELRHLPGTQGVQQTLTTFWPFLVGHGGFLVGAQRQVWGPELQHGVVVWLVNMRFRSPPKWYSDRISNKAKAQNQPRFPTKWHLEDSASLVSEMELGKHLQHQTEKLLEISTCETASL